MGAVNNAFEQYASSQPARVDFDAVKRAALANMETVARHYLPNGYRSGDEWICTNPTRNDARPGSFKVNLSKAIFSDFATGDKGDAIDLVAYLEGRPKLEAARDLAGLLGVTDASLRKTPSKSARSKSVGCATVEQWRSGPTFPPRTQPGKDGKPTFIQAGDEGPRVRDNEKRRHVYRQGGVPVRIKIMTQGDDRAFNAYRVSDTDGTTGWQYAKPAGYQPVPYVAAGTDPFASSGLLFWPEGEKDTETVASLGLDAFTFGGTGDGLPAGCERYVSGRDVVILADNDEPGREHAGKKAALIHGTAASVRIVEFPDVDDKGDVSDWIAAGHTADELTTRASATAEWQQAKEDQSAGPDRKPEMPYGFSFGERGLMFSDPDDLDKPAVVVAGHFDIEAETRDGEGSSWGVLLRWKDHDGREHRLALPRASLAGDGSEARRLLMDGGFYISPTQKGRSLFNSFLLQVKSPMSGHGEPHRTALKALRLLTLTLSCALTSLRRFSPARQARSATCWRTGAARAGQLAMDRRGALPAGAFYSCRRAKSHSPTKRRKTVAGRSWLPVNMCASLIWRRMLAPGWACSRTCTVLHQPMCLPSTFAKLAADILVLLRDTISLHWSRK